MVLVSLLGRLFLAAIFAVAGVAKLRDREASRRMLRAFGVPPHLVNLTAGALPVAELAAAVLLLPARTAWWGGAGTLALLLLFLVAITVNLARGLAPDCNCFGQIRSTPIGWSTVVRNGVLVSLSLLVMLTPAPYPPLTVPFQRAGLSEIATVAIAVVVSLETLLIFELFRQRGRLLLRMDTIEQRFAAGGLTAHSAQPQAQGLDVGARAPSFVLRTPSDKPVDLAMLMERGKPLLLVFSDPGCGSCVALLRDVKVWQRRLAGQLTIAVVTRRTVGNESAAALHDLQDVLLQDGNEISQSYGVAGTPAAVLVRPDGTIGCPVSFGKAAIEALLPPPSTLVLEPSGGLTRVVAV